MLSTALTLLVSLSTSAQAPARLSGPADVVELCRHLTGLLDSPPSDDPVERARQEEQAAQQQTAAYDREYEIHLPPREFRFGNYDSHGEVLDVASRLSAGRGLLDLQPNDVALELDASPAEASEAYRQWRAGKGLLRVTFDLDDVSRCEGSPASPPWLLPVRVLSLSYVSEGGALWLNGANGLAAQGGRATRPPGIAVAPVVPLAGRIDAKRVAISVQGSDGLQACYAHALDLTPQLEGTVVFEAKIDGRGRTSELQVTLEDLGVPELVTCLGNSLRGVRLAGASPGSQLLLPLELLRL